MGDKYGISFALVPIDNEAIKATPVPAAAVLPVFAVPNIVNCRVEVLYVGIGAAGVLAIDAAETILMNLSFHDASADSDTTLVTGAAGAAGDMKAAYVSVIREVYTLFSGVQSMENGDTLVAVSTFNTPTTAGDGYFFLVAYRIKEWGGQ